MATKKTELEIRSKGGDKVESDLKKIGAVGEQTGKKIEKGSKQASKGLKAVDGAVKSTNAEMRRMSQQLGPFGAGLSKVGAAGLVAAGGILAVSAGIRGVVAAASEAEKADFKIEALLKTTGNSSGQTAESIERIAQSIGQLTLASTAGVRDAAAALLSFRSVTGTAFERTLKVSQDIASVMGTDVKAAAIQLAKALEDPERNLSQLNRSGISFTTNQIDMIKALVQTGQEAEALSAILGQIEGQIGGAGEAEATGLAGKFDSMAESVQLLAENIGEGSGLLGFFSEQMDRVARGAKAMNDALFPDIDVERFAAIERVAELSERLESGGLRGRNAAGVEKQLSAAKAQLKTLNDLSKARADETRAAQEGAEIQRQARVDERAAAEESTELAKAAAAAETKRTAEQKKFTSNRKRALADIARLESKAIKAGLDGVELLAAKRDEELLKQFDRLNQELITSQEFAAARVAIEKTFEEEKADIAEKALKSSTKDLKKGSEEAAKVFTTPFSNAAANIQSSFGDTFTDIYRNGVTRFEDLTDAIRDIMARLAGEITALLIFRPAILSSGIGGLGLLGGSAAAGAASSGGTGAAAGTVGGFLAGGSAGMINVPGLGPLSIASLQTTALAIGAGVAGNFVGQQFSNLIGLNSNATGNIGGLAGGGIGAILGGPLGAGIGAFAGNLIGSFIGNGFGFGGGNDKQKFGFGTGAGGIQTPFGGLNVTASQNVDSAGIIRGLANLDEAIAAILSPGQIERVRTGLSGTGQFFSVQGFDNEAFDVVKTRLVRIIDAVAENTVASGLLNSIGRDPGNIDDLVQSAQGIIELINMFQDDGAELNQAEQALAALNEQFDTLASTAEKLGFSIEEVETRREQAVADLLADFNDSIADQILAIENPLLLAFQNVEQAAQERLDNARTLGADLVEVERLNLLERQAVIDAAFSASNSSIESFLGSLQFTGAGGLSLGQQVSNATTQFNELLAAARTDPAARSELASFLPTFLGLKREELGSTAGFFEFTSFLTNTLGNLVDQDVTVSTLQDIGSAITIGDNAIVTTLQEEIGSLKTEIVDLRGDLLLLMNSPAA